MHAVPSRPLPPPDLTTLSKEGTAALRTRWRQVFGPSLPCPTSREFLLYTLAWHQQAHKFGGLSHRTQSAITQFKKSGTKPKPVPPLPVGTVLLKTYQGTRYTVTVQVDGFAFEDSVYLSLSEIARRITGTRWNGPAFFGLRGTLSKQNKKASNE